MSSKVALYFIAILAVFFAYQTAQVVIKRHQTENDIQTFEKQVADLKNTQGRLQELNQFLETDFFAEKEARLKLGMQKPGEEVVVLDKKVTPPDTTSSNNRPSARVTPDISTQNRYEQDSSSGDSTPIKQKSNPNKWWDYFFAQGDKE